MNLQKRFATFRASSLPKDFLFPYTLLSEIDLLSSLANHRKMPRVTRRQRRYNLCKRLFFDRIRNKIIHEMLYDVSSEGSEEAEATNFFALSFLQVMTSRYIDRAPRYLARSYIVLESALEMSDTNFLLHFRIPKESFMILVEDIKDYWEFQERQGRYGSLYRPKAPV